MKQTKILSLAFLGIMALASCGSSKEDFPVPGSGGSSTDATNTNANKASASLPSVVAKNITRLEFPKTSSNGHSYVVVHKADGDFNFASEWDTDLNAQRWTCYNYNKTNKADSNVGRSGDFRDDPDLKEQYSIQQFTLDESPYKNSGFDRGHLLGSDERQKSLVANQQTFYFTNMHPQYANFNQKGLWTSMETEVKRLGRAVIDKDTLFVVKGGTIDNSNILMWIKNNQQSSTKEDGYIPVAKYFFVALLKKQWNSTTNAFDYHAFGYWFEHTNNVTTSEKLSNYIVNIDELESKTGIDFFCNLPDETEKKVQSASVENIKSFWGYK